MKRDPHGPADTRMIPIVHWALRRDLQRARQALATAPYPSGHRRAALAEHVRWMMDFLHDHHRAEDELWPLVRQKDPSAGPLLDQLDADHLGVSEALECVRRAATAYAETEVDANGARLALLGALDALEAVLLPHLEREERELLPLVAQRLSQAEFHAWDQRYNIQPKSLGQLGLEGHWLLDGIDPVGYDVVVHEVPPIPRFILLKGFAARYRRRAAACWGLAPARAGGVQRSGQVEVVVDAPPQAVWRILADVTRVGAWSHECRGAEWLDGATAPAPRVRFRGRNKAGNIGWSRISEIVTAQTGHELAWRTLPSLLYPDSTEWRIRLEPFGSGTRIVQSFQVLRLPAFCDWLYSRTISTHRDRTAALAEDLRRLGALAARQSPPQPSVSAA